MKKEEDDGRFWKRHAVLYDMVHVRSNGQLYSSMEKLISRYLDPGMHVLELASGSGNLAADLADRTRSWTGLDYSEDMVEKARKRCIPNASFDVGNAMDTGLEDETFDAVIIANALQVMPHPDKALSEACRVLVNHGTLICPTFVHEGHVSGLKMLLSRLSGFPLCNTWDREALLSLVSQAGFEIMSGEMIEGRLWPVCLAVGSKTGFR